jgi:hypothetical protein
MAQKGTEARIERYEDRDAETKLDRAIEILMKKLDISERDAKVKIAEFSRIKNLDTEMTCEVLIKLEKIISKNWFEVSAPH